VSFEWQLLRTYDHPSRETATPKKARRHGRPLQAEGALGIPDARMIDGRAHSIGVGRHFLIVDFPVANDPVQCRKVTNKEQQIERDQAN